MSKLHYDLRSLKSGLTLATLVCWILPIIIIVTMFSVLVNFYNDRNIRQSMDMGVENAMHQVELRLLSVIEDSKAVSYDGVVRQSSGKSDETIYKNVTDYLTQKFTRSANYRCVFVSFFEPTVVHAYAAAPGTAKLNLLRYYKANVFPAAQELMRGVDTGIYFMTIDGEVYMVRNLLDHDFVPYAILVIGLEKSELFQSLFSLTDVTLSALEIDGVSIPLSPVSDEPADDSGRVYTLDADGHTLTLTAQPVTLRPLSTMPMLRWAIFAVALLGLPMLLLIVFFFYRGVSRPMDVLSDASRRVQNGERGYVISQKAPNTEFAQLYSHFNAMSTELKSQFDRLYLEQQALQQAKIKALQSQINPHFLNNTLEIINWEARLADNERVCSMIEALSTMLDAAIGRDGRSEISLSEELQYVDAYLHITKERLGDRLSVEREIDETMLDVRIPRLMLQPIIENAVEHDLSRAGGTIRLHVYRVSGGRCCFDVEHDGCVTAEGWSRIRSALSAPLTEEAPLRGGSVGMRNVNQRLHLLYGDACSFEIFESRPGRVMARILLPDPSWDASAG